MVEIIDKRNSVEYHFDDIAVSVRDGCRAIFDSGDIVTPLNVQLIIR